MFVLKVLAAAAVISLASWLAGRAPILAGFLVALPISTAIVLPMAYLEHDSAENTFLLARSIALAVPMTLVFFVPFLAAERLALGFWQAYGLSFVCLGAALGVHRLLATLLFAGARRGAHGRARLMYPGRAGHRGSVRP